MRKLIRTVTAICTALLSSCADGASHHPAGVRAGTAREPLSATTKILAEDVVKQITETAAAAKIAKYDWVEQGVPRIGYPKGMAVAYAVVYARWKGGDPYAREMARAVRPSQDDALYVSRKRFARAHLRNDQNGTDTLRHLFVLMIGMGMRESDGKWYEGRDENYKYTGVEAEAGIFQSSLNVIRACLAVRPSTNFLNPLFRWYQAHPEGYVEIFQEGRPPDATKLAAGLENHGIGEAEVFQKLSKASPLFATEFAAIAIRYKASDYWAVAEPQSEVKEDADALFQKVQQIVDASGVVLPARPLE